ncbi:hypothetical protein M8J77_003622 [Diaphorina citri]|nr:hypothetical protein M8J77_003622 [Diaphorina citri]
MKFVITFVAILACAYAETAVQPSGYLADTAEVSQAKAEHFAEKARIAYAAGTTPDYYTTYYNNYYRTYYPNTYNAPATITVLPNGYLADTPEVASAKAAHFAEHAKALYSAGASQAYSGVSSYASPYAYTPASITVLPNGYLADTPEVAAAKASHLAEVAKASAQATPVIQAYNTEYNRAYSYASPYAYTPASITVLPNGYLADTPEVAAAKASHLAEVAKASAQATPVIQAYNADYNRAYSYASPYAYTPASITVLPNGYLADTPEVAAAKVSHFAEVAKATSSASSNPFYSEYYTWNGNAWVANQ